MRSLRGHRPVMSQDESSVFGKAPLLARHHFINDFLEVGGRVRRYRFGNHTVERLLAEFFGKQSDIPRENADQDNLLEFFVGVGGRGKGLHEVQEDFGHLLLSGRIPIDAGSGTHKTGRYELALQVVIYTQLAVSPFFLRARCHKSLLVVKADWREWYRL